MSTIKTFEPAKCKGSYSDKLSFLSEQIQEIKKEISYLDLYNITAVIDDPALFYSITGSIFPNSAAIINCDPFFINDTQYKTGDILLKIADGSLVHIKATTSGVYYPSSITDDGQGYVLTYEFSSSIPTQETSKIEVGGKIDNPVTTIQFTEIQGESDASIYGNWFQLTGKANKFKAYEHGKDDESKTPINPMCQFFFCSKDGSVLEEIYADYNLTLSEKEGEKEKEWEISGLEDLIKKEDNYIFIKVK